MASVTITIPDEHVPDVIAAFVQTYRWRSELEDGPQAAWPKKCLITHIRNITKTYRLETAARAAREATEPTADVDLT